MNELLHETSPYLLQHAQNPVHWKAWNPASLALAQTQNKLLLISVGYSACHWCHVMEHETFENAEAAALMNAHFVNIKVDREERPDVDAVYMKAVQIMTSRGGWPLNVVALPDGRPVWGGTYFGREDWMATLEQLHKLHQEQPERLAEYATKLNEAMHAISVPTLPENPIGPNENQTFDAGWLEALVKKWKRSFDHDFGGMARAPKFMLPNNYQFLLRYAHQNHDQELLDFVHLTLTRMAWGGIFDTVGGGFSRYSVDLHWHVPHFEKMLYDNAQLVSLYADAFRLSKNPLYAEIIRKTLDFCQRELRAPNGGFYSALDADSPDGNGKSAEGAYYVWTELELRQLLGDDFNLFAEVFNINPFGHLEHGHHVLIQTAPLEAIAERNQLQLSDLQARKNSWEQRLSEARDQRARPGLDDKCLASWNAMMVDGYTDAYRALGDPAYLETALQAAGFITTQLWPEGGTLYRNFKAGRATIPAYLEDYAWVIRAWISLYTVTFDEKWLREARQLTDHCLDQFFDDKAGFFAFTSKNDAPLVAPHFETEDNVIPASNSVMGHNLKVLSVYFGLPHYARIARQMLDKISPTIDYPSAFSNWLDLYLDNSGQNKELAILGLDATDLALAMQKEYHPHVLIAASATESTLPFLQDRFSPEKTLFYVCQNQSCDLPTDDFETVKAQLAISR